MYPWIRLVRVGARLALGSRGQQVPLLSTTRVRLRVWPNDLDLNFHVNNGRYLSLADLGRMDWIVRTGIMARARRRNAYPVVGDAVAKFRRDLRVFQAFEIHTRLLGWDSKWGFMEHRFIRAGRVIGMVAARGAFKGPTGLLHPSTVLADEDSGRESPPLPDWARLFHESSDRLSKALREEERLLGLR